MAEFGVHERRGPLKDDQGIVRLRQVIAKPPGPLVICDCGYGHVVEQDDYHAVVQLVDEAEPMTLEKREAQPLTRWLVVTLVNLQSVTAHQDIYCFHLPAYAHFENDAVAESITSRSSALDMTDHVIDLANGTFRVNQIIGNLTRCVWLRMYVNRWVITDPRYYDDPALAVREFTQANLNLAGAISGPMLDILLDYEEMRVLGILLLGVGTDKLLIPCTIFAPDGSIVSATEPDPPPDG